MRSLPDGSSLYRELVTRAPEPMIITDQRGLIRFENSAASRLTGEAGEDRTGRPIFEFVHEGDHDRLRAAFERAGDLRDPAALVDCRVRHLDGRLIAVEVMVSLAVGGTEDAPHVLLHVHDVSERLSLLARLRQEHKLSSLGHMANGVADDLARVMETIRRQLILVPATEAPPFSLRVIRKAAETGAALAQQLKAFAEMPSAFREQVDVHVMLKDMRSAISGDQWLDVRLDASSALVRTDRESLRQGLSDLVLAFARAMPEGSVVSVTTRNLSTSRQMAWRGRAVPIEYLAVEICNTARGLPLKAPRDLFDPNVPPPVCAGIMLALVSLDDVSSHSGGYVEVSTNATGATIVAVYVPVG